MQKSSWKFSMKFNYLKQFWIQCMNRENAFFNIIDEEYDNDLILDAIEAIVLDSGMELFLFCIFSFNYNVNLKYIYLKVQFYVFYET